jgi:hypothetical protein
MSKNKIVRELALLPAGGIIDLIQDDEGKFELLKISGSETLTGALSILSSSQYYKADMLMVVYSATMDFNGKNVDIFGKTIPPELQAVKWVMLAFWTGTAWDTYLSNDPTVPGSDPVLEALVSEINSDTDEGKLLIGQDGTYEAKEVTGAFTLDKDGVAEIPDNSIGTDKLNFGLDSTIVGYEKVLTNGQLTNLFTNPIEILADSGVGAGNFVGLVAIALSYRYDAASLVLADDFELQYNDGTAIKAIAQANLIAANDAIWTTYITADVNAIIARGIRIQAKTSNPSGGGAATTLKVRIYYTVTQA